jgi:hypothetical protein
VVRWSAVNILFLNSGELGADEWRASHSSDEDNAEKEMRQFVWCLPSAPVKWDRFHVKIYDLRFGPKGAGDYDQKEYPRLPL